MRKRFNLILATALIVGVLAWWWIAGPIFQGMQFTGGTPVAFFSPDAVVRSVASIVLLTIAVVLLLTQRRGEKERASARPGSSETPA